MSCVASIRSCALTYTCDLANTLAISETLAALGGVWRRTCQCREATSTVSSRAPQCNAKCAGG